MASIFKVKRKQNLKIFSIDKKYFGPQISLEYQKIVDKYKDSQERIARRKNT